VGWFAPDNPITEACYSPWFYPKLPRGSSDENLTRLLWAYEQLDPSAQRLFLENIRLHGADGVFLRKSTDQVGVIAHFDGEESALAGQKWLASKGGEVFTTRSHKDSSVGVIGWVPLPQLGNLSELPGLIYVIPDRGFLWPLTPTPYSS